jgi:hypothetical protein
MLPLQSIDSQNILKEEYVVTDMAFRKQKASEADMQAAQNCYEVGVQRVIRDFDRWVCGYASIPQNKLYFLNFTTVDNNNFITNIMFVYVRCKATRSTDICNNLLGLCHLQVWCMHYIL